MRNAACNYLARFENFSAISGSAEHTLLPDTSIDMVLAAQAFHWFDAPTVRKEFERILKPKGKVLLLWNERLQQTNFEKHYDELIVKYAKNYVKVEERNIDLEDIKAFFAPASCELKTFTNFQDLDFEGLKGRLLSSSFMPKAAEEGYPEMIAALRELFDRFNQEGKVRINYIVKLYIGSLF